MGSTAASIRPKSFSCARLLFLRNSSQYQTLLSFVFFVSFFIFYVAVYRFSIDKKRAVSNFLTPPFFCQNQLLEKPANACQEPTKLPPFKRAAMIFRTLHETNRSCKNRPEPNTRMHIKQVPRARHSKAKHTIPHQQAVPKHRKRSSQNALETMRTFSGSAKTAQSLSPYFETRLFSSKIVPIPALTFRLAA